MSFFCSWNRVLLFLLGLLAASICFAQTRGPDPSRDQHGAALACARLLGTPVTSNLLKSNILAYVGLGEDELAELMTRGELRRSAWALTAHPVSDGRKESIENARQDAWRRSVAGLIERRLRARRLKGSALNEFVLRLIDKVFAHQPKCALISVTFDQLCAAMNNTPLDNQDVRPSCTKTIDKNAFFAHVLGLNFTEVAGREMAEKLFARLPRTTGAVIGVDQRFLDRFDPELAYKRQRHRLSWFDVLALQVSSPTEIEHLERIFKIQPH